MHIRVKQTSDHAACLQVLLAVHAKDRYPRFLPADVEAFVTSSQETVAWVAEVGGQIVGHVALHDASNHPILPAAQRAAGLRAEQLAVLARLFVAPEVRGTGVGQQLLATATEHAEARGQRLVLDVEKDAVAAMALYEAAGWTRLETLYLTLDGGQRLDLWVYLGPASSIPAG